MLQNFVNDKVATSGAPTTGTTVTITPATAAKGAYTQISTALPRDTLGIHIMVFAGSTAATIRNILLDVGVDPAGGTAYQPVISNILAGSAFTVASSMGRNFYFPLRIRAGSTVALRAQGTTADTFSVIAYLTTGESQPVQTWTGTHSQTIGTITGTAGVTFTPGTSAYGAYTLLGTTTRNLKHWTVCVQISNTVIAAKAVYVDLAYGNGTSFVPILNDFLISANDANENITHALYPLAHHFCDVPAGSGIYIRAAASSAPETGFNAVAIGIGG